MGGGKICNIVGKTQARARSARAGGGVWEGGVPPPRRRSFCIFEIEIERSGEHFGWIFLGKLSVKK